MRCRRCSGLLAEDHYLDLHSDNGTLWDRGFRCLNCGSIVDRTILRNRRLQSTLRLRLLKPVAPARAAAGGELLVIG